MSNTVNLALSSEEVKTVVYGLLELRRVLALSSAVNEQTTDEADKQITAVLMKMDDAVTRTLDTDTTPVLGAQKLADMTTNFVSEIWALANKYNFCGACALGAAAEMLSATADAADHDATRIAIETSEAPRGNNAGGVVFIHKAGNA
jgi:hypothetical protein